MEEQYVRNIERLVAKQHEDQSKFHKSLEAMMSQMVQMTQILEARDREIVELRGRIPSPREHEANQEDAVNRRVPFGEIAGQIPVFGFEDEDVPLEIWLRKVNAVKAAYGLTDEIVKMLATNKFAKSVKKWYESQESLWDLPWENTVVRLKEMFGEVKDITQLMEKIRARKWKRTERLEDYYLEKLNLAKKAELSNTEIIQHIIRGIDNFTIRVQLASGQHESLESLFKVMKGISSSLGNQIEDYQLEQKEDYRRNYR